MEKEYDIIVVNEKDVPDIVAAQFEQIQVLSEKVEAAMTMAEHAKESAEEAHTKSAGFGKKKEAIESIQGAMVDLAEAQISAADAQKVSFEYQQQLGKITQYLFALGCSNIAANR